MILLQRESHFFDAAVSADMRVFLRFRFASLFLLYTFLSSRQLQNFANAFVSSNRPEMSVPASIRVVPPTRSPLVSPVVQEHRKIPVVPWSTFFATAAFLPVWAVTLVPCTALFLVSRAAVRTVKSILPTPARGDDRDAIPWDSGYVVEASRLIPRSQRKYDIVVLGVTGFCGRLAARHLAKTYGVDGTKVKWAVAGRSKAKLEQVKAELAAELGLPGLKDVDSIVVDTSVPATLPALVEQTRVVATTAGPYILYGNHVCEFCAKFGTHYVDITGEVDWVKSMQVLWHKTAQATGAKLISFCGNDSIPWDLSLMKLRESMEQECGDDLVSVSFWDEFVGEAPGGTYATIVTALDGLKPPPIAYDPFVRRADGTVSTHALVPRLPFSLSRSKSPFDGKSSKRWQAPFIMALVNHQVCAWSQALRSAGSGTTKSVTYTESIVSPDFKSAFVGYASLFVMLSFAANPLTRFLLPQQGPELTRMEVRNYLCVTGVGTGAKGHRVESVLYFPKDPGCLETARMLMESGLCLALQEDELPEAFRGGGFFTPSTALGTVLLERLLRTGTTFQSRTVPLDS